MILKHFWRKLTAIAWPDLVPVSIGMDQHFKGGLYENFGQTVYKGTKSLIDYEIVSLVVNKGRYEVVDFDPRLIMATVQARVAIKPGDSIIVYQGSDDRFWIRPREEYNQKFTEIERY